MAEHPVYTEGQRVEYVGTDHTSTPNYFGKRGVITSLTDTNGIDWINIRFDGEDSDSVGIFKHNIRPEPASKEAVDAALALLRSTGEVSYIPFKPPYTPAHISGVGGYIATVGLDCVRVGCNRISFEKVDEVAKAVAAARAYNAS